MLTTVDVYVTTEKQLFDMIFLLIKGIIFYKMTLLLFGPYIAFIRYPTACLALLGFAFPAVKLVMKMKKAQGSELM